MKKNKFFYLILFVITYFTISFVTGCKSADQEVDYIDYGTSVFQAVGDASQAGLDISTVTGDSALASAYANLIATLDNNSKVFTVNVKWVGLPSAAVKAQLFAPADSGVFVSQYSMWDMSTSLSGIMGGMNSYRLESTALRDYEEAYLRDGKVYFTITSANYTPADGPLAGTTLNTSGAHTVSINGVSTVGYGVVRGQIQCVRTFFKNKPTCYYVPEAQSDSVVTNMNVAVNGNLAANDHQSNSLAGTTIISTISNVWSLVTTNSPITITSYSVSGVYVFHEFSSIFPLGGTVLVNSNGTFTYTPTAGFTGTDFFFYRITDANGHKSQLAYVKIKVK